MIIVTTLILNNIKSDEIPIFKEKPSKNVSKEFVVGRNVSHAANKAAKMRFTETEAQ